MNYFSSRKKKKKGQSVNYNEFTFRKVGLFYIISICDFQSLSLDKSFERHDPLSAVTEQNDWNYN